MYCFITWILAQIVTLLRESSGAIMLMIVVMDDDGGSCGDDEEEDDDDGFDYDSMNSDVCNSLSSSLSIYFSFNSSDVWCNDYVMNSPGTPYPW